MNLRILITGVAGFIGSSLAERILSATKSTVIGVDIFTDFYNPLYKKANLKRLKKYPNFVFFETDIRDEKVINSLFSKFTPQSVVHLAALTGVRTSFKFPNRYNKVNILGTETLARIASKHYVQSFIFASSSSVYGSTQEVPFRESQKLKPMSPYAKTKLEGEKILLQYAKKSNLPVTILRLFSVYGPNGRPDMAPYLFTEAAFSGREISQFGDGTSARDYTFIEDVVRAFENAIKYKHTSEIINIGNSSPIPLSKLVQLVEQKANHKINRIINPANPGESIITYADIQKAKKILQWIPQVSFEQGMHKFINWYKQHRL